MVMENWLLILLVALSAFVPLLCVGSLWLWRRRRKRRLLNEGKPIVADVVGFTQEPLYRYSNGSSGLYITVVLRAIAEATLGNRSVKFESDRVYKQKCHLREGDRVKVLVRVGHPKQYYFDPHQEPA